MPQSPRKWEFDVSGHIVLARTEAAPATLVAPPPRVVAPRAVRPPRACRRPAWWLSALGVVAACIVSSWAVVSWLEDFADTWVDSDYKANSSLPVLLGLAGAWGAAYVLVAYLGGRSHDWRDPWRPPADAYRDLATPRRLGAFGRGLVAAVPVNIVLIAIASMVAARLGYAWLGGSEGRDDASRFTLVVLALAGLIRYLTWPRRA